jgi:hypothetical protein
MTSTADRRTADPARAGELRVAFYGRVACDPNSRRRIENQRRAVTAVLPAEASIVACFADVAAWDGLRDSVCFTRTWRLKGCPVEGGRLELLDRACHPRHDVDVVAGAVADRLSRRIADLVRIEDCLAGHNVSVVTPTDPAVAGFTTRNDSGALMSLRQAWGATSVPGVLGSFGVLAGPNRINAASPSSSQPSQPDSAGSRGDRR